MSNNQEEPFLLSDYQMYEIKKLTKQLEDIRDTIRAKNNFCNRILYAFGNPYPIEETHKKVYHVSGFKPIQMYKILFSQGLKWGRHKGIYYNTTEYGYRRVTLIGLARGYKPKKEHISELHAEGFWRARSPKKVWVGPFWFRIPTFMRYIKRFGVLPLNVTYEIDTNGFEKNEVYYDRGYANPPTDENGGNTTFRYIPQLCIKSQYIRLKAITLALPMFDIYKVLWRRKE